MTLIYELGNLVYIHLQVRYNAVAIQGTFAHTTPESDF